MMIGKAKRDVMRAQELVNIVVVPLPARQHVKEERQTLTVLGKLRRKLEQYDGMRPGNAIGWRSQIAGPTSARRFPQMLLGEIPTVTEPAAFVQ